MAKPKQPTQPTVRHFDPAHRPAEMPISRILRDMATCECEVHHPAPSTVDYRPCLRCRAATRIDELVAVCKDQQTLIEDMARFVGQMALKDYALFNDAPINARHAIRGAEEEY